MKNIDKETAMKILYGDRKTSQPQKSIDRETAKKILFSEKPKQIKHYVRFYYYTHPEFDTPECYETHEINSRSLEDVELPSWCEKFEIFDAIDNYQSVDGKLVNLARPINLQRYFIANLKYYSEVKVGDKHSLSIDARRKDGVPIWVDKKDILIEPERVQNGKINSINSNGRSL